MHSASAFGHISSKPTKSASKSLCRNSARSNSSVLHNRASISKEYGGLGQHYYDKLGHELDKILQVKYFYSL